jgi:DNA replication and repair protein RecF
LEIKYLKLLNFRNFTESVFQFQPAGALILGRNGIGKTNLLEAIAYFAFGKSFQNSKDADLINFSKAFFRLEGIFNLSEKEFFFSAAADHSKKIIQVDGETISRISDLYRFLKIVYFSPVDINIAAGSPSFRRSFIDQAVSQYSFDYILNLRNFNRILKQRNALLKSDFDHKEKRIWDIQFVHLAALIIQQRLDYLEKFAPLLQEFYHQISGKRDKLSINYKFSFPHNGEDIKTALLEHLEDSVDQEIHYERSLSGPHLDDIDLMIDQHPVRQFGSQGQKRSLTIALRLVQAKLITNQCSERPILMFDDVLSDLDKNRASQIMNLLRDEHQIFIATPNKSNYSSFQLEEIDLEQIHENE